MAIKQIVGTSPFQDPQGIALASGSLTLDLSQPAVVVGSGEVAPTRVSISLNSSGTFAATNLWANDQLSPSGTSYRMRVFNSNGLLAADMGTVVIQGASPIDVSALIPVTTSPAVSVSGVVFTNPTAMQTISGQPLALSDNNTLFFGAGAAILELVNTNAGASAGQAIVFVGDAAVSRAAIKAKTGSGAGDVGSLSLTAGGQGGDAIDGQFIMASTGAITLSNKIVGYNGINTVANGVPSEVASFTSAATAAAIGTTTLYATPASPASGGLYRLSYYLRTVIAGNAVNITATLGWSDDSGAAANTLTTGNVAGAVLGANSTTALGLGQITFVAKGSSNITYSTSLSGALGAGAYVLTLRLESLG